MPGFGSLVKLPLGRHAKSGATSFFRTRLGWASCAEDVVPFDVSLIPEMASIARPVAKAQGPGAAPFACISHILNDGAGQGVRDNALYHFARYAVSTGLPAPLVEEWVTDVNGGFDPPLSASEVRTKIRSALHATTANPGCSAEWLKGFCPGGERCFAPWNDRPRKGGTSEPEAWLSPEARRAQRKEEGQ